MSIHQEHKKKQDPEILKALRYMDTHYPGPHSFYAISDFCGVSRGSIQKIYNNALKKIDIRIKEELKELMNE